MNRAALRHLGISTFLLIVSLSCVASARGADVPQPGGAVHRDEAYHTLRATQEVFRSVAASMKQYLVRIETVGGSQPRGFLKTADGGDESAPPRPRDQFRESVGANFVIADGPTTGLVYDSDGYIIASGFNFVRDPVLISVILADGRRLVADLVARDQVRKIALLKVEASDLPVPTWVDIADVHVGQWAIALGLGFGGSEPAITVGIVSAHNRMLGNAIQTDAKLGPANYGGPLCDVHGRVIGICVPMAQRPGELAGIEMYDSGVGFAVPKHRVDEIVKVLKTGTSFYRGWLGIQIDGKVKDGVVVRKVAVPSPMADADIRAGDRILAINDKKIGHYGHLVQAIYMIPAGGRVYLHMRRGEREFGASITLARNVDLGALPEDEEPFDPSAPIPDPDEEKDE